MIRRDQIEIPVLRCLVGHEHGLGRHHVSIRALGRILNRQHVARLVHAIDHTAQEKSATFARMRQACVREQPLSDRIGKNEDHRGTRERRT